MQNIEAGLEEYLSEIRKEACSRCVERPPGGPPCGPLGKWCGVENNLPELIDAVHDAHGRLMGPYCDSKERHVCEHCPVRFSSACPCPMDQLLLLVVQAVEAVEGEVTSGHRKALPGAVRASLAPYNTAEELDRFLEAVTHIARGRLKATYEQAADGTFSPAGGWPRIASPMKTLVKTGGRK